jgi:hypothetical protein
LRYGAFMRREMRRREGGGDACMNDITVGHVCSCISKAALLAFIVPYLGRNEREGITLILFHCSAVLPYTILH